jgi:hypothetical protein
MASSAQPNERRKQTQQDCELVARLFLSGCCKVNMVPTRSSFGEPQQSGIARLLETNGDRKQRQIGERRHPGVECRLPGNSKMQIPAKDGYVNPAPAAAAHGQLRYSQGYTPAMLVDESRLLQVTIFGTLQSTLNHLDFSLLLSDVITFADEVGSQLTQSMDSYMKVMQTSAAV